MATIRPFAALRPKPELVSKICALPYDVMSSEEARTVAAGNPLSFLRVSKPEIDLAPSTDPYAPEVYAKGRENFLRLIQEGALRQDPQPAFYVYRQVMGEHQQTGLVAVASCQEYLDGVVRKHELTRVDKEDDRVRHIDALNAQTGPAFLVYRAQPQIDQFVAKTIENPPAADFVADDGVRHTAWVVSTREHIQGIQEVFGRLPTLYIADGHHRSAAAARVFRERQGAGQSGWFLSVIFPHNQVRILAYNRALTDLNGLTPVQLLGRLEQVFTIADSTRSTPDKRHEVCFFLDDRWHTLRFRNHLVNAGTAIETLDVSLLQKHVLDPVFGIEDPRTSKRIHFIGGIRGTTELEKVVKSGEYACAFSLFPTGIEELITVADGNGIMPPKSTWFEPKLRDAMFCHML